MGKLKKERQIEEYRLLMGEEKTQKQLDEAKRCWFCGALKGAAHSPVCRAVKRRGRRA